MLAQVLGSLPPMWATWIEFWAPGVSVAQSALAIAGLVGV